MTEQLDYVNQDMQCVPPKAQSIPIPYPKRVFSRTINKLTFIFIQIQISDIGESKN